MNKILKTITYLITFLSIVLILYIELIHFKVVTFPYQHEFREGAIASVVSQLNKGIGIYNSDSLPEDMYVYGIGMPYIIKLFSVFSNNNLLIARVIIYVSNILSLILLLILSKKLKINLFIVLPFLAVLSYLQIHYTGYAFPNGLAVLFVISILAIPFLCNFSQNSLIIAVLLSVFGGLIKQYVILEGVILLSFYFFFIDYRKGFIFSFLLVSIFIILIATIHFFNNSYLSVVYYSFASNKYSSFQHMKDQVSGFIQDFWYLFIILTILVYEFFKKLSINFDIFKKIKERKSIFIVTGTKDYSFIFLYSIFVASLLFIFKLGRHTGSGWGIYLHHIFIPFAILCVAFTIQNYINVFIRPFIIVLLLYFPSLSVIKDVSAINNKLIEIKPQLDIIKQELLVYKTICGSPEITSLLAENNRKVYNNGQTEYFIDILESKGREKEKGIIENHKTKMIKLGINKSFDLVTKTKDYFGFDPNYSNLWLSLNYKKDKELFIPSFLGGSIVEFWVLK